MLEVLETRQLLSVAQNDIVSSPLLAAIPQTQQAGYQASAPLELSSTGSATVPTVVDIPDANLLAAIRSALNKPTGDITDVDMQRLGQLDASSSGISDLTGLQYAANLNELYLRGNDIGDISELSGLTRLWCLDLGSNHVGDVSAMSGLTQLQTLRLDGNQISDISVLSGMGLLSSLDLSNNQISDISPLSSLSQSMWLRSVDLDQNRLGVWPGSAAMNVIEGLGSAVVTYVQQHSTSSAVVSIPDVSLLAAIRSALNAPSGDITVADMQNLTTLNASDCGITDLTGLEYATNLTVLNLSGNQIADISLLSGLSRLSGLSSVDVSRNLLDLSPGTPAMSLLDRWAMSMAVNYSPQQTPAPTDIAASNGTQTKQVTIGWRAPASATSYALFRSTSSDQATAAKLVGGLSATSYTDTTVLPGQSYYYWVRARYYLVPSALSAPARGYALLKAPTGLGATSGTGAGKVHVSWTPMSGASSYRLLRSSSDDVSTATRIAGAVTDASYNDPTAAVGQEYYYWVAARYPAGISSLRGPVSGYAALPSPAGVAATQGARKGKVHISWQACAGAVSYTVLRSRQNDAGTATSLVSGITTTAYNDLSTVLARHYYYWVVAVYSAGPSVGGGPALGYAMT